MFMFYGSRDNSSPRRTAAMVFLLIFALVPVLMIAQPALAFVEDSAAKLWILTHAELVFALCAAGGAILHWAKKAARGEITWNPVDYWLVDNRLHSAGALGALVLAVWGIVFSGSLSGMQAHMIVAGGFTLGYTLDSGINKGGAA
jgi:hypothetical protein